MTNIKSNSPLMTQLGRVFLVLLLSAAGAAGLQADTLQNFYVTRHSVADQSVQARNRAVAEGFGQLLVRLSGRVDAQSVPAVAAAKRRASAYLQEFRYVQVDNPAPGQGAGVAATTEIELHFSEVAMLQLLRSAGLPFWPPDRPQVLVWLVVDDYQTGMHWLTSQEEPELAERLAAQSRQFGVPLITPLLDLQDQLQLSPEQLWSLDTSAVKSASARYDASGILVGRYAKTSQGEWRASWTFFHKDQEQVYDSRSDTILAGLQQAVLDTVTTLASRYAIVPSVTGPEGIVVQVDDVDGFADYQHVLQYLEQLPMVRSLSLSQVVERRLTLTLYTEGSLELLQERFGRDGRLQYSQRLDGSLPDWQRQAEGTPDNPLLLRWLGV